MFVRAKGTAFELNGVPFPVNGANNYYATFRSEKMAGRVFDLCGEAGFNVLRTWAFFDTERADGWVWFQGGPGVFNDGANGLELLDRAIAMADARGLKLILPLVNHWDDFGGMKMYASWLGLSRREEFYTDARARDAYRRWVEHVILRVNTRTGRQYRDEPAIMAWELANEPRCAIPGGVDVLLRWVEEMSGFVRALDGNHLVGVGDEGFFRRALAGRHPPPGCFWPGLLRFFRRARAGRHHTYNGEHGVDCEAILGIPAIDFGTCHLYPSYEPRVDAAEFGSRWIREHFEAGERAGKPMLIEEYGLKEKRAEERDRVFDVWWRTIEECKGAGGLLWMIAGEADEGGLYPDYDGYTVYAADEIPAVTRRAKVFVTERADDPSIFPGATDR
jgi:mannan endo-1,4-beta-mannosidase